MPLDGLFTPKSLDHYRAMAVSGSYQANLNQSQVAAVLKAHDYGLAILTPEETRLVEQVMSVLKDQIWP
ncbi:hypothetical protein [Marinobacter sp. G11]|uniref:hypothetical protein n=1 Tax=Marinobacter sp. G11 TaxID=2903522 RepID=UPI001E33EF81|nr:hypothetical protein [Marinobacter sp. G11]